jgi:hypothetical protein
LPKGKIETPAVSNADENMVSDKKDSFDNHRENHSKITDKTKKIPDDFFYSFSFWALVILNYN